MTASFGCAVERAADCGCKRSLREGLDDGTFLDGGLVPRVRGVSEDGLQVDAAIRRRWHSEPGGPVTRGAPIPNGTPFRGRRYGARPAASLPDVGAEETRGGAPARSSRDDRAGTQHDVCVAETAWPGHRAKASATDAQSDATARGRHRGKRGVVHRLQGQVPRESSLLLPTHHHRRVEPISHSL